MHELGICRSLIDIALAAMKEHGTAARATSLDVQVGRFTSVVPDSLQFYFDVLKKGTVLEDADLRIETIALRTRCSRCAFEETLDEPILSCSRCGGPCVPIAGRELRLVAVDVAEAVA